MSPESESGQDGAARTSTGCDKCAVAAAWDCARGPDGVLQRILDMRALVASGAAREVPETYMGRVYTPWSELAADQIDEQLVRCGPPQGLNVTSVIEIQCRTCDTRYRQTWSFDRGNEWWTVTAG